MQKKIVSIVGARPQFIKYAPLSVAFKKRFKDICINTGQHYDDDMSAIFFRELKITQPKYNLNIGSGSHSRQTGEMMIKIEKVLLNENPHAVVVFGDTNTTLAGALAASKLNIPIVHIEAGLRSYNMLMPEEKNRIITDHISDILIAPTKNAIKNLRKEGIKKNVFLTGDIMVDALMLAKSYLGKKNTTEQQEKEFILVTVHRNYNTDKPERLLSIVNALNKLPYKVVFPVHPRTLKVLKKEVVSLEKFGNIHFEKPLGYFRFIDLLSRAKGIITDSGGVQKEAYILKIPCITLRYETEWLETLKGNWNVLVGDDLKNIKKALNLPKIRYIQNLYGDGTSANNIAEIIFNFLSDSATLKPKV